MTQKLINYIEDCTRTYNQSVLDLHIVFHQLISILANQIPIENLIVDTYTNKIALNPNASQVSCPKQNRAIIIADLLKKIKGNLSDIEYDFINALITNDTKKIKNTFRIVLMPAGFEAIGYGDHSVVIKAIENTTYAFKYMKCDNPQDKLIKEKLGEPNYFPAIPVIPHSRFVSSIYCQNGTLTSFINNNPGLTNSQLIEIFLNICKLVNEIHAKNILIRDIKPDNILIDEYLKPHISDFDVALVDKMESTEFVGTVKFMAPEVKINKEKSIHRKYGVKSEIYSLGCVLSWMFTHQDKNFAYFTPLVPPSIKEIALKMLSEKPEDRPTLDEIEEQLSVITIDSSNSDDEEFGLIASPFDDHPSTMIPRSPYHSSIFRGSNTRFGKFEHEGRFCDFQSSKTTDCERCSRIPLRALRLVN